MEDLSLRLPDELQQFVNEQVEVGRYNGATAYIEALVARAKKSKESLDLLLIEGLDSGEPIELNADEWSRIRSEVEQRLSDES